jgi:hypothetical protein
MAKNKVSLPQDNILNWNVNGLTAIKFISSLISLHGFSEVRNKLLAW